MDLIFTEHGGRNMKRIMLFAAAALAAVLSAGCSDHTKDPEKSSSAVTETAAAETADVTETSTAAAETAAAVTAATSSETASSAVYEHRAEVTASAFDRSVPEKYRSMDAESIPKKVADIIDNGGKVSGILHSLWIDKDSDEIYLCVYYGDIYGYKSESLTINKGYSFYRLNGNTGELTFLADDDDSPLRNFYAMMIMDGKLLAGSYHGFYLIDGEAHEIVTLDPDNEPLGGSTMVRDGKVYLISHVQSDTGKHEPCHRIYDPLTGEMTDVDGFADDLYDNPSFAEYADENNVPYSISGVTDENGALTYVIEW